VVLQVIKSFVAQAQGDRHLKSSRFFVKSPAKKSPLFQKFPGTSPSSEKSILIFSLPEQQQKNQFA